MCTRQLLLCFDSVCYKYGPRYRGLLTSQYAQDCYYETQDETILCWFRLGIWRLWMRSGYTTRWGLNQWSPFCWRHPKLCFCQWNVLYINRNKNKLMNEKISRGSIYSHIVDYRFTNNIYIPIIHMGLYSLRDKTFHRKISWSLEATGFGFRLFQSLWNLTGSSAAALPRCLSNPNAIR